nr:hypothetical protein [uncultured Pseudodesulfovibrio sp.]
MTDHMDRMVDEGFFVPEHWSMVQTDADPDELLDQSEAYGPPQVDR